MWLVYTACWIVGAIGLYAFLVRTSKELDPRTNFDSSSLDLDVLPTPFVANEPEEVRKAA